MQDGKTINFLYKGASEKTASAKPASAKPASANPTPEKKASDATDKAMMFAEKAGRPTGTGIAAGVGLGTTLAALGALSGGDNDSLLSRIGRVAGLGALGLLGGYAAGNSYESIKPKDAPSTLPKWLLGGSLYGIGSHLAKKDVARLDERTKRVFELARDAVTRNINGRNVIDLDSATKEQRAEFYKAEKEYRKSLERQGLDNVIEREGLKGSSSTVSRKFNKFMNSRWNPLRQLRAINPLQDTFGLGPGLKANWLKERMLDDILRISGPNAKPWFSPRALPSRAAVLAALTGAGWLGVNGIRKAVED